MKHVLLNAIEHALAMGCDVSFKKRLGGYFDIQVTGKSLQHVSLPTQDHLNEEKCAKYITMLTTEATKSNQLVEDDKG